MSTKNGIHAPAPPEDLVGVRVALASLGTVYTGQDDDGIWWARVGDVEVGSFRSEADALEGLCAETAVDRRERTERLRRETEERNRETAAARREARP